MDQIKITNTYQSKILTTNTIIQVYVYSNMIRNTYQIERENYQKALIGLKDEASIRRAKTQLFNLIASNVTKYSKFMTLTTRQTTLDRNKFLTMFNQFRKNFKRNFGYNLKYVAVIERQKKRGIKENNLGSYHMHLIVFNESKLDFKYLKKSWSTYGSIDIKILREFTHIPVYLMKYLSKEIVMHNDKSILVSHHLKQPQIEYYKERLNLNGYDYKIEYDLPNNEKCIMYEYKINRSKKFNSQQIKYLKF